MRVVRARQRIDRDRRVGDGMQVDVEHGHLHRERLFHSGPLLGGDAGHHRGRPERHGRRRGLHLAVRIAVLDLGQ
jgi:hypothetical protein